jgi:hypothetical protein
MRVTQSGSAESVDQGVLKLVNSWDHLRDPSFAAAKNRCDSTADLGSISVTLPDRHSEAGSDLPQGASLEAMQSDYRVLPSSTFIVTIAEFIVSALFGCGSHRCMEVLEPHLTVGTRDWVFAKRADVV